MKATKFLLFLFLLILSSFSMCKKEKEWTTLPPETQKGANTFGCYVNGELFISTKGYNSPGAYYVCKTKKLRLGCMSSTQLGTQSMGLYIDNPQENEYNSLIYGCFLPDGIRDCNYFACDNCGRVLITKLDTINRIVSGTFEFSGRCSSLTYDESGETEIIFTGDSIVQITNGRFDIKLDVYNE